MLGALAALTLLPHLQNPLHPFNGGGPPEIRTERSRLAGGWTLSQAKDPFKGVSTCRLEGRNVRYGSGVVTFSFGHAVDTANALFRVDGGPVVSAGEVAQEAAGLGAPFLNGNLSNPSDGRVRIPWSKLVGAQRVDIRANAKTYHRTFMLAGLDAALAAARGKGCSDLAA